MQNVPFRQAAIKFSQWLFTPVALLFLFLFLWQSRSEIAAIFVDVNRLWLFVSVSLWLLLYLLSPLFSTKMLQGLGGEASYKLLLYIFVSRLPAKYLPGGIWQTVARIYDLRNREISNQQLVQLIFFEVAMPLAAAFTVGGVMFGISQKNSEYINFLVILLCVLGLLSLLFMRSAQRLPYFREAPIVNFMSYWKATLIILVYWCIVGFSFAAFMFCLNIEGIKADFLGLSGAYVFSWAVGYVSFFAPQGLGVLEYVVNQLVHIPLSTVAGISVVFSFRLMIVALDLLAWIVLTVAILLKPSILKNL